MEWLSPGIIGRWTSSEHGHFMSQHDDFLEGSVFVPQMSRRARNAWHRNERHIALSTASLLEISLAA
jgi:hypothetical protein